MTLEEIRSKRTEAENKIIDIVNALEIETQCKVTSIDITSEFVETFGEPERKVGQTVNIILYI
jgi:hypothetical protein